MKSDFLLEVLKNRILWTSIFAWFIAQIIKMLIDIWTSRKIDIALFISSGGMPSSHTAFIAAMATSVGLIESFSSTAFAIAAAVCLVVMYDAAGVRRAAGNQAVAINMLVEKFEDQGIALDKRLKELLGHTPFEVFAGMLLGILIGVIFNV